MLVLAAVSTAISMGVGWLAFRPRAADYKLVKDASAYWKQAGLVGDLTWRTVSTSGQAAPSSRVCSRASVSSATLATFLERNEFEQIEEGQHIRERFRTNWLHKECQGDLLERCGEGSDSVLYRRVPGGVLTVCTSPAGMEMLLTRG